MENREILVANTRTQRRDKVITNATTLGELKSALTEAGIDFHNMTFTEGISKTQLLDDATQLPQNVMYKGNPTNNLVILLTNTKKNIASGIMDRKEAYQTIKDNNLQDAVKEEFGRNFTQVPTSDLVEFIAQNNVSEVPEVLDEESTDTNDNLPDYIEDIITNADINSPVDSLYIYIAMLAKADVLSVEDLEKLNDNISYLIEDVEKEKGRIKVAPRNSVSTTDGITDGDIDDMLDELGM